MLIKKWKYVVIGILVIILIMVFLNFSNKTTKHHHGEDLFVSSFWNDECISEDSTFLQYTCYRKGYRNHMRSFASDREVLLSNAPLLNENCRFSNKDDQIDCIFNYITDISKLNINKSKQLCDEFGEENLIGECIYYVVVGNIIRTKEFTKSKINYLMSLCSDISDFSWNSECYFVIADELSFLRPLTYLTEIKYLCNQSTSSRNFGCEHHVILNMPYKEGIEYCSLFDSHEKIICTGGIGWAIISKEKTNFSEIKFIEKKIPEDSIIGFYVGVGRGIAMNNHTVSEGRELCQQFEPEVKDACLFGFSLQTGNEFSRTDATGEICQQFPKEYRYPCFRAIGRSKYDRHNKEENEKYGKTKCQSILEEGYRDCIDGYESWFNHTKSISHWLPKDTIKKTNED